MESCSGHRLYRELAGGCERFDLARDSLFPFNLQDAFQEVNIVDREMDGRAKVGNLCQRAELHEGFTVRLEFAREDSAGQFFEFLPLGFVASVRR